MIGIFGLLPAIAPAHEPRRVPESPTRAPSLSARPSLGVVRVAPDFALRDPAGRVVRLSELRGQVVLIAFIYTSCSDACPLLTQRMAVLQAELRTAGLFPARVALVSVSVDPERDDAATLARYAQGFRADPAGWFFLREDPDRLSPMLSAWDEWTRRLPDGGIDHPARIHLVDMRGRVREIYNLAFFDERQASLDIRALLTDWGVRRPLKSPDVPAVPGKP